MGRKKKGFNWRARNQVSGHLADEVEIKALQRVVDSPGLERPADVGPNALVLPTGKKRLFKAERKDQKVKLLSKRQRKKLEKIVDTKRKKQERADLIDKLQTVQVNESHLAKLTSITSVQTKGLKRKWAEEEALTKAAKDCDHDSLERLRSAAEQTNPLKKINFKKLVPKKEVAEDKEEEAQDENILGFNSSSDESSEEEEEMEEDTKTDIKQSEVVQEVQVGISCLDDDKNVKVPDPHAKNALKPTKKAAVCVETVRTPRNFIAVTRSPDIQRDREKLPILSEEHAIMEAIMENSVVIISGETGSGKTTQLPQFLYEAGYTNSGKLIGITEPRRVAAMAMAKRVGEELNSPALVSYQIRFEGNTTEETQIKFMTDGVLLREMSKDFRLKKYSVIVIDEAHERSVFTDILIGNLSRIVPMREKDAVNGPLKLIIMSATLRVEDFTKNSRLFKSTVPPVISVDSRQFETTCHFQKTTPEDYMSAALKMTSKIHRELPEGGILVFVTGQQEVNQMVRKLRKLFPSRQKKSEDAVGEESLEKTMSTALKAMRKKSMKHPRAAASTASSAAANISIPKVSLDSYATVPLDDTESDVLRDSVDDELDELEDGDAKLMASLAGTCDQPMWTLPLYSLLSSERQKEIFQPVPEGHRLCVVSTNIAETSLTIPGIKYVVDTGKVKTKFYDRLTGVSTFLVTWASKAQASQRAGRAGRVGPGHCYRLFSSEVFKNDFPDHSEPEIIKRPVDDLMLQMKAMKIVNVMNFPFPTPPDSAQLRVAEQRLLALGALRSDIESKANVITELGKSISLFPVAPNFGKMLALSEQHGLMPYTITMVAALSVQEVLLEVAVGSSDQVPFQYDDIKAIRQVWAGRGNSFKLGDPMVLVKAVGAAELEVSKGHDLQEFCNRYALRYKAMLEIRKLRRQLTNEINIVLPQANLMLDPRLGPPNDGQARLLRQVILAGMVNNVAYKVDADAEIKDVEERAKWRLAYRCGNLAEPVFIHSRSVFAGNKKTVKLPEWVVYQEVFETDKMFMRGVSEIEPEWLPMFATSQCHFFPPLQDPEPWYESSTGLVMCKVKGTFGPQAWPLPTLTLPYPDTSDGMAVKLFARFFLEGKVCAKLAPVLGQLLCVPSTLVRGTSLQSEAVRAFVEALASHEVSSLDRLAACLAENGDFLKQPFKRLVPKARHSEVDKIWGALLD